MKKEDTTIAVIKRDGRQENYDEQKLVKVVKAAGLEDEDALSLAKEVTQELREQNLKEVSSLEIRDKVLPLLREKDDYAANLFEWYQKIKEDGTP